MHLRRIGDDLKTLGQIIMRHIMAFAVAARGMVGIATGHATGFAAVDPLTFGRETAVPPDLLVMPKTIASGTSDC